MSSTNVNWEDEESNRIVSFVVDFTAGDEVELHRLTPTKVTFLCPDTQTPIRSIGVHREAGRGVLVRAFENAGQVPELKQRLKDHDPKSMPALQVADAQPSSLSLV